MLGVYYLSMAEDPKGCRHWERTSPDSPWELAGIHCFSPCPGIVNVAQLFSTEYGTRQQVWFDFRMSEQFSDRSRIYAVDGTVISTLRCRLQDDRIEQQYVAADDLPITTLHIFDDYFEVLTHAPHLDEGRQKFNFAGDDHLIEFFERDGIHVSFESLESVKSEAGDVVEYRNENRRWNYWTDDEGRRIKTMYKNGEYQRERYVEDLMEPVSFPLSL